MASEEGDTPAEPTTIAENATEPDGESAAGTENGPARGQEPAKEEPAKKEPAPPDEEAPAEPEEPPDVFTVDESVLHVEKEGLTRLNKDFNVWIDKAKKRVVLSGEVVRQEGPLELFMCLKQAKEHESVVSVHTEAKYIHAALLAIGAESGHPVKYQPEFQPPTGTEIEVTVLWRDEAGELKQSRGQDWVRNFATGKAMEGKWVFAGSYFWKNPQNGEELYQAEAGDVICVSNFTTAMIDVAMESSATNSDLLFEAFRENIPKRRTRVTVLLTPKLEDGAKKDGEKQGDAKKEE